MMVEVRLFDRDLDGESVLGWATARDYNYELDMLPPTTWIVPDLAIVAVYTTNQPKLGFLDHLLSNPHSDAKVRDKAVQDLLYTAIRDTYEMGMERWVMYTSNPAVIERARKQFFCQVTEPRALMIFNHNKLIGHNHE